MLDVAGLSVQRRFGEASYGMTGCHAYDANSSSVGCESNAARYCLSQWCYVDMTLCPINKLLCLAEGGLEGSDASPHCRTRPHFRSTVQTNMSLYYSYETCGYMNNYDLSALFSQLGGTTIKVAAAAHTAWVIIKKDALGQDVFGGALYDIFIESLVLIQPPPVMKLIPGWATQQSRAIFSVVVIHSMCARRSHRGLGRLHRGLVAHP